MKGQSFSFSLKIFNAAMHSTRIKSSSSCHGSVSVQIDEHAGSAGLHVRIRCIAVRIAAYSEHHNAVRTVQDRYSRPVASVTGLAADMPWRAASGLPVCTSVTRPVRPAHIYDMVFVPLATRLPPTCVPWALPTPPFALPSTVSTAPPPPLLFDRSMAP